MVRVSATAKAGSSTLNSLRTAAVIVSGFVVVRITIDAVGKVDCQNGREACGRGFSSRLALRMSSTTPTRSEEHTSELQSRLHLVCRLLLEKKKNTQTVCRFPLRNHTLLAPRSSSAFRTLRATIVHIYMAPLYSWPSSQPPQIDV